MVPEGGAIQLFGGTRERGMLLVQVERQLVLKSADPILKLTERALCARDRLYFISRWVDIESKFPIRGHKTVPFLPFVYQARMGRLYDLAREQRKGIFEDKSRQLGLSWWWMAVFLHGLLFEQQTSFFATSRRQNEVDDGGGGSTTRSIFGRLRFMYEALPPFLRLNSKGAEALSFKALSISNEESGSFLTGEAATTHIARGGSYDVGLLDEFAHVEQSESAWASADDAITCPIVNSTPLGEDNKFAEFHRKLSRPKTDTEEVLRERFLVSRNHWSEHPLYARDISYTVDGKLTSPWYRKAISSKTPEKAAQELDISYSGSLPGRYFPEFSRSIHVPEKPIERNRLWWLYLSCDHGLADTEIWGLWQTDGRSFADLLSEWHTIPEGGTTGEDLTSKQVAVGVQLWLAAMGLQIGHMEGIFPDPAGAAREQTSGQSHHLLLLQTWADRGQYPREGAWIPANNEQAEGVESVRLLMAGHYAGGPFTFRVSPTCTYVIDCLVNYRRKITREGRVLDQEEQSWANHGADMVRYFCHTLLPAVAGTELAGVEERYTTATRGRE